MGKKLDSFLLVSLLLISRSLSYVPTSYEDELIAKVVGYRLPNNTAPILYTLNLEPHIDEGDFTFDGTSSSLFRVLSPTRSITLHASLLIEIDKTYTTLIHSNGSIQRPISQRFNTNLQFFNIRFAHILDVGNYTVKLKWKGHDATDLRGFYRAVNMDEFGNTQYMVATHFEPVAARSAFPCWDEPAFKAEFDISLKHYNNYTALSNMPVKEKTSTEDGKVWTSFDRTPIMSTYLATFVVGPYVGRTNVHGNITFWVPSHLLQSTKVAHEVTPQVVSALEEYTGFDYSLPKLDAVLIPQYSSSATEHWGLISYAKNILFNPDENKLMQLKMAVTLAAHEIIHQWLGNIVTPAWWSDLWLSESFAVYLSNKIVDDILPNFHAMELFVVDTVNRVSFDAERWSRGSVHPIKWMPDSPTEVMEMFSPVTYRKGAAVVRMLEHMITEQAFQSGIRKYITEHQFASVVTDDLWSALQAAYDEEGILPHLNIKEIMDPWVQQTGYPMLNITRDYETGFIAITQDDVGRSEHENSWAIPINYVTSSHMDFSETRPTDFIGRSNSSFNLYGIDKNDWVIFNIQQTGFYRVNYDWENWKRIIAYLNTENYHKIHVLNRAQLLYDVIFLAMKEPYYLELLLDMVMYLRRETNYLPWMAVQQVLDRFTTQLINTPGFNIFRKFVLHLMNNIVDHIGFQHRVKTDHYVDYLARVELLSWACAFGHAGCKAIAPIKLMEIMDGKMKKSLGDDDVGWIYCTALATANETLWDRVMDAHQTNPRSQRPFKYLGCSNNQTLITHYLSLALADNSTVLSNDLYEAFESLILGPAENYNFALDYFINNFDRIQQYLNARDLTHDLARLRYQFSSMTKTLSQYEKLSKFLNKQAEDGKMSSPQTLIKVSRESMRTSEHTSSAFLSLIRKKPYLLNFIENYN